MKNVTPKEGQVWECNCCEEKIKVTEGNISIISARQYTLIPQNDLEWLAVNVDEWRYNDCPYVRKLSNTPFYNCDKRETSYTRQQWQNMRYELRLDERPKPGQDNLNTTPSWYLKSIDDCMSRAMSALAKDLRGPVSPEIHIINNTNSDVKINDTDSGINIEFTARCNRQKETKMINLSSAKVGDKFDTVDCDVIELVSKGTNYATKSIKHGHHLLHKKDGRCDEYKSGSTNLESDWDIVANHDPRPWLKDLPDADSFLSGVKHLRCDSDYQWLAVVADGDYYFNFTKTPTLTGDQWRDSKISIDELRAWQKLNKENK